MTSAETSKNKASYSREGRKQLFAVLQSARGSSGDCFHLSRNKVQRVLITCLLTIYLGERITLPQNLFGNCQNTSWGSKIR